MTLLDEVKRALEPFAEKAGDIKLCGGDHWTDDKSIQNTDVAFHVTFGDFRRARSALAALEAAGGEEMVERVAKAIYEAASGPWDFASEHGKDMVRHEARAAIAAMKGGE